VGIEKRVKRENKNRNIKGKRVEKWREFLKIDPSRESNQWNWKRYKKMENSPGERERRANWKGWE
jgi:hypothetical protein